MLTQVYFRRKDLEGVTHKDTRAREMVEVWGRFILRPIGPPYIRLKCFKKVSEEGKTVEVLISHMKGLETENQ